MVFSVRAILLWAVLAASGCSTTLAELPRGFVLVPDASPSETVPLGRDNRFDPTAAREILGRGSLLLAIVPAQPRVESWLSPPSPSPEIQPIEIAGVRLNATPEASVSLVGHRMFAMSADFQVRYVVSASVKTDFKYVLEYNLPASSPHFRMEYIVDPLALREVQDRLGERAYVLFQRHIFAPDTLSIHELVEAAGSIDAMPFATTSASTKISYSQLFGRRFVLRKYERPELVETLLDPETVARSNEARVTALVFRLVQKHERTAAMFEPAREDDGETSTGDRVNPWTLRFYRGRDRFKLTDAYASHCNAEGVRFDCSAVAETQGPNVREDLRKMGFSREGLYEVARRSVDYRVTEASRGWERQVKSISVAYIETNLTVGAPHQHDRTTFMKIQRVQLGPGRTDASFSLVLGERNPDPSVPPPIALAVTDQGEVKPLSVLADSKHLLEVPVESYHTEVLSIEFQPTKLVERIPRALLPPSFPLLTHIRLDFLTRYRESYAVPVSVFVGANREWHDPAPEEIEFLGAFTPTDQRYSYRNFGLHPLRCDTDASQLTTRLCDLLTSARKIILDCQPKDLPERESLAAVLPSGVSFENFLAQFRFGMISASSRHDALVFWRKKPASR